MRCGIDMVTDERVIKNLQDEGFTKRFYHDDELALTPQRQVTIFALKEAAMKATGQQPRKMHVTYEEGIPSMHSEGWELTISASHEEGKTIAIVIARSTSNNTAR